MILRDYQQKMRDAALEAYHEHKNFLAVIPTGGGKTITCAAILEEIGLPALFLAHTTMLVQQADGVLAGLAICNTIQSEIRQNKRKNIRVVVIDEAHHAVSSSYRTLLARYPDAWFLGLTATPSREGLCHIFPLFSIVDIEDLICRGYLCPIDAYVLTGLEAPEDVKITGGDYNVKELGAVCDTPERNRLVVDIYKSRAADRFPFVFCVSIAHAKHLCAAFREAGIEAYVITGENSKDEQEWIIRQFEMGNIRVLLTVQLLTEGVDVPRCDCIINMRPTKSPILYTQMIGRALRLHPAKESALVIDLCYDGHSLRDACTMLNRPTKSITIERRENKKESDGTSRTITRQLSPIQHINSSVNVFSKMTDPYLVEFHSDFCHCSIIWCKKIKTKYMHYVNVFYLITMHDSVAEPIVMRRYEHDYLAGATKVYERQVFANINRAIEHITTPIELTRREATVIGSRPLSKDRVRLVSAFKIAITNNPLEDYCKSIQKRVSLALKSKMYMMKKNT